MGRKTCELYNMGITLTNAHMKRMDWFRVSRDLFKGGRTGFGWFQGGKDWFRLVSCGKDWFRLVPLFSNYQLKTPMDHTWSQSLTFCFLSPVRVCFVKPVSCIL